MQLHSGFLRNEKRLDIGVGGFLKCSGVAFGATQGLQALKHGEVDIVVNNAATGETGPIAEIPVERVRRVFDVNVFGTLGFA